ncbi:ATP synthase subunit delta, mitochondrial [Centruroides vittatus]|uniref:ATP synthase subunit delta, mitochondrial-like n=1 Tax=Centruroides sculpturatus TaxID=218467 RepID=UPI000C6DA7C9|nr:ATP synthase subunit delta, mitochondrial-like [Centruroides sculpturatus]
MSLLRSLNASRALLRASSSLQSRGYASGQMSFTFGSPYEVYYNKSSVKQVDVPSYSGSFGILPNHVPCLAVLKPGVVTVFEEDGATKKYFVSSGSITINDDSSVQVLAEEAVPLDRLDPQACREGLSKAQQELSTATSEEAKAEAQISLEVHEALVKAVE